MTEGLTIALGVLVGIAFIALIVQLGLWLAIYLSARRLQSQIAKSAPAFQSLAGLSRAIVTENRQPARAMATDAMEIGRTVRREVSILARFGSDVGRGIHHEQEHAGVVIEDARRRMHETVELVSRGVTAPFRGLACGLRRAARFFERRAA